MNAAATDQEEDATAASSKGSGSGTRNSGHANSPVQLFGPAALGVATGYLTGTTEFDSYVLAAVIPAVLATAGSLMFVFLSRRNPTNDARQASIVVGVFSMALLCAAAAGNLVSELSLEEHRNDRLQLLEEHRNDHFQLLAKCSQEQFIVNTQRVSVSLEPLRIHQICPEIPPSTPPTSASPGAGATEADTGTEQSQE